MYSLHSSIRGTLQQHAFVFIHFVTSPMCLIQSLTFFFHFKRLSDDVPEAATQYRSSVLSDTFNVLFGHLKELKSVGWGVIVVVTTQQWKLGSKSNLWKHS